MSKVNLNEIDNKYYDVLREIGNIGAGNATTALAQLLNMKLDMRVPKVELLEFNKLAETICGEEDIVVGIWSGYDDNRKSLTSDGKQIKYMWADIVENYLKEKEGDTHHGGCGNCGD